MPENQENEIQQANTKAQDQQQSESKDQTAGDLLANLDLANLDLSVEAVEERISPSETNVFDK